MWLAKELVICEAKILAKWLDQISLFIAYAALRILLAIFQ